MVKRRIVFGLVCLVGVIWLCGCGKVVDTGANVQLEHELSNASVTVYPTFVRKLGGPIYDSNSAEEIAAVLKEAGFKSAEVSNDEVPIAGKTYMTQWKLFNQSKDLFILYVKDNMPKTDYAVIAEYLITPLPDGGQAAGGIHCYVLDTDGRVAIAILLNSHHKIFAEAKAKSIEDCTAVLIKALKNERLFKWKVEQTQ